MIKLAVSRAILFLLLVVPLVLVPIAGAATWSSPSMITDPSFCGMGISGCPSISGDGSKIAFATNIENVAEIFVINSDGTGLTQLTNNTKFNNAKHFLKPSISDDGSKIAFQYDDGSGGEIFLINSDGTGLRQLTDFEFAPGSERPSISDDGGKIAFFYVDFETWNRGIFLINSDGTGEQQLTENFERDFSMSGDGNKIAFLGGDNFDFQYFVINTDGTELTKLTQNSNKYQDINNNVIHPSDPSISDDGSKVAFEGYVGSDIEIFVINSDGTGLKQLTDNTEDDWAPFISGDGSRIAFQRTEHQEMTSNPKPIRPKVYVINSDGTGLTQLTDDSEREFHFPSISDNGERIVFWSCFFRNPESEVDFEYEIGISVVNYLSEVEDENGAESTLPIATVVGGILPLAVGVMVILYLKKKPVKL